MKIIKGNRVREVQKVIERQRRLNAREEKSKAVEAKQKERAARALERSNQGFCNLPRGRIFFCPFHLAICICSYTN